MRGDIISVIDLRIFFNLPVSQSKSSYENMIILRLEDNTIGVIVDSIEKVIGIDSSRKQAPHPLFGDINIKYIDAVVENESSLYIILDAERIFNNEADNDKKEEINNKAPAVIYQESETVIPKKSDNLLNQSFVEETLATYLGFYPSPLNREWITARFKKWIEQKGKDNFQLKNKEDAQEFLKGFFSQGTGQMWNDEIINSLIPLLPELKGNAFVWNPGCGRGYESYSIASLLKKKNPELILKVQGNDNDLINISSAPGLSVDKKRISSFYEEFIVTSPKGGSQFNDVIKDSIIFEYSDLANDVAMPPLDMVVCRDTLSYMPESTQQRQLDFMYENLKPGGLLMLGDNEIPIHKNRWNIIENNTYKLYKKK